jgi:hypothetical protein
MIKNLLFSANRTKTVLASILLMGASLSANAQGTVSYKIVSDDPLDVKNAFLSLQPFFCEAGATGDLAVIGYGFQANYNLGKRLAFEASFSKAYLDINADRYKTTTGTSDASRMHTNIEAGAELFLSQRVKMSHVVIGLSASQYSSTSMTIPASIFRQMGFRGGFFYYNYALHAEDKDYFLGQAANSSTVDTLRGINTNMNVPGTYVGVVVRKTTNVEVSATGYGYKKNRRISEYYFDVLLAPVVTYSSIIYQKEKYVPGSYTYVPDGPPVGYDLSPTTGKHFGWRLGWQFILPSTVGFQYKAEIGQKPGWGTKSGYYIGFGFGMTIGANIKIKPNVEKTSKETN